MLHKWSSERNSGICLEAQMFRWQEERCSFSPKICLIDTIMLFSQDLVLNNNLLAADFKLPAYKDSKDLMATKLYHPP